MDLDVQPPAEAGAGDPSSWHDRTVQEEKWREAHQKIATEMECLRKSLRTSSPAAVMPGANRSKELKEVFSYATTLDSPRGNIASPVVQACYPALLPNQQRTLANQVFAMIADYHMTCVIHGPSLTSPITSQEIEERLPCLIDYTPSPGMGVTDVRVADSRA